MKRCLKQLARVENASRSAIIFKADVPPKINSVFLHQQQQAPPHPWIPKYKWSPELAPSDAVRREQPRVVTLFGGSGFLGTRVVRQLLELDNIENIRIATRFPDDVTKFFADFYKDEPHKAAKVKGEYVDITDRHNILAAAEGSQALVNLIGIPYECELSFREAYVDAAHLISHAANVVWATRVVQLSHIAAENEGASYYADTRFRGEDACIANFKHSTILRSAPMFGKGSVHCRWLVNHLARTRFYPCFGPNYKVTPVWVEDVASAVVASIMDFNLRGYTIECVGPQAFSHKQLIREISRVSSTPAAVLPLPAKLGYPLASLRSWLPSPPYTLDHMFLIDNGKESVESGELHTLNQIGIEPHTIAEKWDK